MNTYTMIFNRLLAIIGAIVIVLILSDYIKGYMRSAAIDGCGNASRIERTNDAGVKEVFPHPEIYDKCLRDKGLK